LDVGEGGSDALCEAVDLGVVGVFFLAFEDEAGGFGAVGVEAIALLAALADPVGAVHEVHEALAEAGLLDFGRDDLVDGRERAEVGVEGEVFDGQEVDIFLVAPAGFGPEARLAGEVVRGDLEAVEDEAGAARVDGVCGDAGDDVADGELDGGTVLDEGDWDDGAELVAGGARAGASVGVVVVAEGLAAEGDHAAAEAVGSDVAALEAAGGGRGLLGLLVVCGVFLVARHGVPPPGG
jgi:hypothetical protein